MKRHALPLLAIAAVLAGCGGGDDDPTTEARSPSTTAATTPATTSTAAPTSTTAEVEPPPVGTKKQEQAIAKAGLLVQADLPGTWKARKESDDGDDGPCPAITAAKRATSARATSATFEQGDATIGSTVYLYETPAQALRQLESINTDYTRDCIVEQTLKPIRAAAKKAGATLGATKTTEPAIIGGSGPRAFRLTVPITAKGRTDEVTVSIGSSRVGRGLALLALVGIDDATQQQLTTTAVRRLTDAQAVGP
jgi:hypothetical protein